MSVKLWIDDERTPPEGWQHWAQNSDEAKELLHLLRPDEVSFDHDLGGQDTTRRVVLWMLENDVPFPSICRVHTANPVGRDWLVGMLDRYGPGVTR